MVSNEGGDTMRSTDAVAKPWPKSRIPKASSLLANDLRNDILRRKLPSGTNFPGESELIDTTGYSRATVREALRLLESEGLIVTRRGPQGGIQVSRPDVNQSTRSMAVLLALSDATLRELFEFRCVVEPQAARLAASAATPEQIAGMVRATAEDLGPLDSVVSFHDLIAEACGNEFYRVTVKVILEIAAWHTPEEGLDSADLHGAHAAHRRVVEHIAAGRGDRAASAMEKHLRAFEAVVDSRGNLDATVLRAGDWPPRVAR
ncbi:FadR/GntR family transcriptional regulator [Leifsonia kafniensis]|uniref:FadR/GntR family transcriptional regulator n=1 Tax=Leifsonia kafniensis TaxID=475957 RepID=A0ABP7KEU3_9MICO